LQASQFNPIATALSLNMSFVARGYSAKPKELASLIEQGVQHKGFSFIHVLSPCPTFFHTFDAWDAATEPLPAGHDPSDKTQAMILAMETEKLYSGLFYREERPTMDQAAHELVKRSKPFEIEQYIRRYT
jgi:2-oxoglutarate ferredoxin oxidoreductase subunit beta